MRTKKISNTRFSHKLDKIFWLIISLLPVLSWLIYLYGYVHFVTDPSTGVVYFFNWLQSNFLIANFGSNPFYSVLSQIFGPGGVMPLLDANVLSLFVACGICNLCRECIFSWHFVCTCLLRLASAPPYLAGDSVYRLSYRK